MQSDFQRLASPWTAGGVASVFWTQDDLASMIAALDIVTPAEKLHPKAQTCRNIGALIVRIIRVLGGLLWHNSKGTIRDHYW